jgi:hypothetical protein
LEGELEQARATAWSGKRKPAFEKDHAQTKKLDHDAALSHHDPGDVWLKKGFERAACGEIQTLACDLQGTRRRIDSVEGLRQ